MIHTTKVDDYLTGEKEHICRIPYTNEYIYHYSKIDIILEILDKRCIWLSHHSTMNDSSEGKLILDKCLGKDKKSIYELLLDNLYMCCFSNYGNLLSQWRAYGDVNIGFDRKSIDFGTTYLEETEFGTTLIKEKDSDNLILEKNERPKENITSGFHLSDCNYISENDHDFNKIIYDVKSRLKNLNYPVNDLDQYTLLTLGLICFSSKHSGFKEETESRLFMYLWGKKPFEDGSRKYIKYKFNESQVKRIVIGPSSNKDANIKKIKDFIIKNHEYKGVELVESTIPFIDSKK